MKQNKFELPLIQVNSFIPYMDHFAYDDNDSSNSSELREFFYADAMEKDIIACQKQSPDKQDEQQRLSSALLKVKEKHFENYSRMFTSKKGKGKSRSEYFQLKSGNISGNHIKKKKQIQKAKKCKISGNNKQSLRGIQHFCGQCNKIFAGYLSMLSHVKKSHGNIIPQNSIFQGRPWTSNQYPNKMLLQSYGREYEHLESSEKESPSQINNISEKIYKR